MSATPGIGPGGSAIDVELSDSPRRYLRRGDRLFREGDGSSEAFFLHSGLVKLVKTAAGGTESLVALRGSGALVGEHSAIDGRPRLTSAIVVDDASVSAVPRTRLTDAVRSDGDFAMWLLTQFSGQLRATTRHVLAMSAGDAVALVATRLSQLALDPMFATLRRTDRGSITVRMPVSQHELATWAGVSQRSVAAALRHLREIGLITTGRLTLQVHDSGGLTALAVGPATDGPGGAERDARHA